LVHKHILETRSFYFFIPEIQLVSAKLLCYFHKQSPKESDGDVQAIATSSSTSEHHHEVKTEEKSKEKGEGPKEKDREKEKGKVSEKETTKGKDADRKGEPEKEKVKGADNASLDALLQRLPSCVSRDLIDQLSVCIDSFVVVFVKIITFT
jgi:regulator of nonsense transcripts 2